MKQDGSVWDTGFNGHGQLGDGSTSHRNMFSQVMYAGVKAVSVGSDHNMVLNEDDSVWVTSKNKHGQLGDDTSLLKSTFVKVLLL